MAREKGRKLRDSADSFPPPFRPPCDEPGTLPLEADIFPQTNARKGIGGTISRLLPHPTPKDVPPLGKLDRIKNLVCARICQHSVNAPIRVPCSLIYRRTALAGTAVRDRLYRDGLPIRRVSPF